MAESRRGKDGVLVIGLGRFGAAMAGQFGQPLQRGRGLGRGLDELAHEPHLAGGRRELPVARRSGAHGSDVGVGHQQPQDQLVVADGAAELRAQLVQAGLRRHPLAVTTLSTAWVPTIPAAPARLSAASSIFALRSGRSSV